MVKKLVKDSAESLDVGIVPEWISDHVNNYRESGGEDGHHWDSTSVGGSGIQTCLLLTTVGRKRGKISTHQLLYGKDGENFIIVGSKGGSDTHPGWYYNLLANPDVELQVGAETFNARAVLATGAERDRLWNRIRAVFPPYSDYQSRTSREIPLFSLVRSA